MERENNEKGKKKLNVFLFSVSFVFSKKFWNRKKTNERKNKKKLTINVYFFFFIIITFSKITMFDAYSANGFF